MKIEQYMHYRTPLAIFVGSYDLNMLVKAQQEAEQKRQEAILSSPPGTPVPPPSTDIVKQMFKRTEGTSSQDEMDR